MLPISASGRRGPVADAPAAQGRCARCPAVSGAGHRQVAVRLRQSRVAARPLPPGRGQRLPLVICGGLVRHRLSVFGREPGHQLTNIGHALCIDNYFNTGVLGTG